MSLVESMGALRKMKTRLDMPVSYSLPLGQQEVEMNALIGAPVTLCHSGKIRCIHCGRETKKSFNQGYCFSCFKTLAECDLCIMRPESCHFHLGTCRDEEWARGHCMQPHFVYIANSSGLKVGITRANQIPTRWMDQGARQAIKIFAVQSRYHSGLIESTIKKYVSDRTDWRKMLKGGEVLCDIRQEARKIVQQAQSDLDRLEDQHEGFKYSALDEEAVAIEYPVKVYPQKVTSLNLDKTPQVSGVLQGIKGQYLIFDTGVINIRKFAGYEVSIAA